MRRIFVFGAIIALAMGGAPTRADGPVTEEYILGQGDLESLCAEDVDNPTPYNIGGACFDVPPGTSLATITITDDLNGTYVGWYYRQRSGTCTDSPLCVNEAAWEFGGCEPVSIGLTPATRLLEVALDGVALGVRECPPTGFAVATGTITAEFNAAP